MEKQDGNQAEDRIKDKRQAMQRRAAREDLSGVIGNQAALSSTLTDHTGNANHTGNVGHAGIASNTGIPEGLKKRVENMSGISMDGVKVHYNSPKPKAVQAYAYTQGSQVYLGPGQEKHLGHELGHVVQQMEGRVRPTGTVNGLPLNDDRSLEQEADRYR